MTRVPPAPPFLDAIGSAMPACDFVAADVSCAPPAWCEVADVLLCPAAGVAAGLAALLDRYPGCAVAVTPGRAGCLVAARGATMVVRAAGDPWHRALACASLAYAGLCAGTRELAWPQITAPVVIDAAGSTAQDGAWSCSLGTPCGGPGWLRVRRWRTSAASVPPWDS